MKLSWSTCARNRDWSKAIRRIRPRFASLGTTFEALGLKHPVYEAVLVGVTDDRPADFLEEVPNSDGYHQTLVGFDPSIGLGVESDHRLAAALFGQLSRAILTCPLAEADREAVRATLNEWARTNLSISNLAAQDAEQGAAADSGGK